MTPDEDRLVLAGATGGYREFRPPAILDGHFQCLWTNSLPRDRSRRLAVVPDGCIDITWINGELTVAGPDVTAAISPITSGSTVAAGEMQR